MKDSFGLEPLTAPPYLAVAAFYKRHPLTAFGYYKEAHKSAMVVLGKYLPPISKDAPLPLDSETASRANDLLKKSKHLADYYLENGQRLKGCAGQIAAAVENGDEGFFVRLAGLIK